MSDHVSSFCVCAFVVFSRWLMPRHPDGVFLQAIELFATVHILAVASPSAVPMAGNLVQNFSCFRHLVLLIGLPWRTNRSRTIAFPNDPLSQTAKEMVCTVYVWNFRCFINFLVRLNSTGSSLFKYLLSSWSIVRIVFILLKEPQVIETRAFSVISYELSTAKTQVEIYFVQFLNFN